MLSMGEPNSTTSSTTHFLEALLSLFSDFTNVDAEGREGAGAISVSVCELMGDAFHDVLQTNDKDGTLTNAFDLYTVDAN